MDEEFGKVSGPSERAHHAGEDGPDTLRRRLSARRKHEAVLRLLRGEDLELVSRASLASRQYHRTVHSTISPSKWRPLKSATDHSQPSTARYSEPPEPAFAKEPPRVT